MTSRDASSTDCKYFTSGALPRGEKATLWPTLFSSPSWDISCTMCLLREGVSRLPTGFHRYLWGGQQRRKRRRRCRSAWRPSPNTLSLLALPYILSCHSVFSLSLSLVFLHASERREREYVFNECSPFPCPRGPFHLHKLSLVAVSPHLRECTFQQHRHWQAWKEKTVSSK